MLTRPIPPASEGLSNDARPALLALSILMDRISAMPRADRDDLFELLEEWRGSERPEERESIRRAMEEILGQARPTYRELPGGEGQPMPGGLSRWAQGVGGRLRAARERAGLSQAQLAERAGLTQSHVSRLENAEHSPTRLTLEKLARALGVAAEGLDPSEE
ncbi:DNA-binding transcriptional repressor PuuR [Aquisphaera giovannonii]|uniref:DNA-binding transcriptional repressor PuuR n=2 Tax=Aquisphaera giovannonii TaxID=406548 RepID=A0A5B9WCG3_9BACT|nr:DNA-binding transcriptional repressor PuuR [Aquisphaera giovannonii]